ncbi:MAG: DUF86 domain-containing protein [Methanospirillaceae archaeon]|nr:DUF86 domain-containing protein [Methanospirillaceae archaeon]
MVKNDIITRKEACSLSDMARFRNRLVHQYFKVDDEVIRDILLSDRSEILAYAEKILQSLKG